MSSRTLGPGPLTSARRAVLHRRVRLIVAGTITYNVLEAVVALTAGTIASSAALIGFGLDSVVEVLSAAAVAWQFSAPDRGVLGLGGPEQAAQRIDGDEGGQAEEGERDHPQGHLLPAVRCAACSGPPSPGTPRSASDWPP